ncbi:hypothetical protein [Aquitalea sp. USM4]|uniref:hypothetical protein n=1 Tax=Aquitalea TaxID=407217 RepID=UPI0010405BD0|nr:hypothetical protein [Aquitalea sp. USM4]QBJ79445.1 hypothetical protein DKK66_16060 [Aquitalea sp. USM4]
MSEISGGSVKSVVDLKDYRQPMVTSIGVILGFLIGFLGQWVTESDFNLDRLDDQFIFGGCFVGVVCLFIALFRMLSVVQVDDMVKFYNRTLWIYFFGVVVMFAGIMLSVFL